MNPIREKNGYAAIFGEFAALRVSKLILWPLVVLGVLSVVYWQFTESSGHGDLRFYILVQFLPMLLIPLLLLLFRPRFTGTVGYWALLFCMNSFATEKLPELETSGEAAAPDSEVLELDRMSVVGKPLTLKKETRLRVIRRGMNEPRSTKKEDRDKMICWLEITTGSHFKHVLCARNGDLEALRKGGKSGQIGGAAGYGKKYIWRSLKGDNERSIRRAMQSLPQNDYFDQDFIDIASSGGQPPRDIPEYEELHLFAKAWIEVETLSGQDKPEAAVIEAIETGGLSLKRYNRLVELTEMFSAIRIKVTEFVQEEQALQSEITPINTPE